MIMRYGVVVAYAAHGDGGERGLGPIIGIYSSRELAKEAAKGKGWYNSDGAVRECHLLEVHTSNDTYYYQLASKEPIDLDSVEAKAKEKRRAELLAGMSESDKEILGLS